MRLAFTLCLLPAAAVFACSSSPELPDASFDAAADVAPDRPLGVKGPDTGTDAPAEAAPDAMDDVIDEISADAPADVASDVVDAGAELEGGDICPGIGLCNGSCSCDAGYTHQFSVFDPEGGVSYLCGTDAAPIPACPKGWTCSGYKGATYTTEACP